MVFPASEDENDYDSANESDETNARDQDDSDDSFFESNDDAEFSLNQLSEAYAEVIEAQTGVKHTVGLPEDNKASEGDLDSADSDLENTIDDNAGCPVSPESIVESILFVGAPRDVKLNSRKIASVLRDVSPKEVTKIVAELNQRYEKENAAYRIKVDGGVFEMVLDPQLIDFQQEFFGRNREVRLSQAAIEVMAVVAYNQPITREQIDVLRNKPSGGVLKQLLKRELLKETRDEKTPKVKYYCTADRFLDLFELDEVADLPQSHDMADIADLPD